MAIDRSMLIKLMGMTNSRHDNEALSFLRKAQALMASENITWQELLADVRPDNSFRVPPSQRRRSQPPNPFQEAGEQRQRYDDADEIDGMFEEAFQTAHGTFRDFLDSINVWWQQKGFLTANQYNALRRATERR